MLKMRAAAVHQGQGRAMAGSRAFALCAKPAGSCATRVCNGARVFMRRKDSYMVEILVGEEESEDQALRRYMQAVVRSGVIDEMRARRRKESKVDRYKRKLQQRAMIRRLRIQQPTWDELYGEDPEPKPFDDFFFKDDMEEMFADIPNTSGMRDFSILPDEENYFDITKYGDGGGYYPRERL